VHERASAGSQRHALYVSFDCGSRVSGIERQREPRSGPRQARAPAARASAERRNMRRRNPFADSHMRFSERELVDRMLPALRACELEARALLT